MMKSLALETLRNEPDVLESKEIQGLYSVKDARQSFWTLKAKIELAIFNDHKKEVKT